MVERKYNKISAIARRRGFFWPSSEIYGGLAGFFDYGPVGSLLKRKIEESWKNFFVIKEGMYLIETPDLMPKEVFSASGHLEHFADPVVECVKCHESYRADHLLKERFGIDTENLGVKEIEEILKKRKIGCPKCKGALEEVWLFNLMFPTSVGPGKDKKQAYLRPETAQGIFVSFDRLFEIGRKKLPIAVCQIGKAYRNEISPRQGMIRLREFTQAEAEIFYNPDNKKHPNFSKVKNYTLNLLSIENQKKAGKIQKIKLGQAVKKGLIKSELQAYYLALSEMFTQSLGIPQSEIRCRQQLKEEKAHYSIDTWDVEVKSEDFGWIEVAAIADRTDYDLKGHGKVSGKDLQVVVNGKKVLPNIMEISFGIDRPFYCVLEHSFREKGKRTFFSFEKSIAPIQVGVFPLVNKDKLPEKAKKVFELLIKNNIMAQFDNSGSIGKMYARADEIGIPICITIDYQTLKDNTVTIRDRDTTKQKRVKIGPDLLKKVWCC